MFDIRRELNGVLERFLKLIPVGQLRYFLKIICKYQLPKGRTILSKKMRKKVENPLPIIKDLSQRDMIVAQ